MLESRSSANQPTALFDDVSVSFRGIPAVEHVDLNIAPGLTHGIIGRSGSGRTTLLKLMAGLVRPDSGAVTVLGQRLDRCNPAEMASVRSRIGFQFQNLGLFDSLTAMDNVLFALTGGSPETADNSSRADAESALDMVGLSGSAGLFPAQLSGGMQRRLGIARAFARPGTELLLFDDPTAGLDPVTASRILELVTTNAGRRTVVVVSGETTRLKGLCSAIHVLDGHRLIYSGDPSGAPEVD